MSLPNRLLKWFWPGERRRAARKPTDALSAYYWDGAEPRPRKVKDVSVEGMYLVTEERWYPNTLVAMTLTRTDASAAGNPVQSVRVLSRVVRHEDDGVGLAFLYRVKNGSADSGTGEQDGVDRPRMLQFLHGLPAAMENTPTGLPILVSELVSK